MNNHDLPVRFDRFSIEPKYTGTGSKMSGMPDKSSIRKVKKFMKHEDTPQASQQTLNAQEINLQEDRETHKNSSKLYDVALKVFEIFGPKKSPVRK